ncbi:acyl-CoA dehydrogenase family protein [Hydrocarboniphaga sp.]|uniref:acyl-CoA dehydrogenase family protein n=1 Tax=Hydrocarboniphaga sp. TaxID=2033016 RepID=UPI003D129802
MDFDLNGDQRMIKDLVDRYVSDRYQPGQRARYRGQARGYSQHNWSLLGETGLLSLPFSADDGGMGAGNVEIALLMETLGRGLVVEPVLDEVLVAGGILATAGSAAQKARWLPPLIAGEAHLAFAFAEQAARWNWQRPQTRFDGQGLSGGKTMVGADVDAYIVSAADQTGTTRCYLVDAQAGGITRSDYRLIDGSAACELRFDSVAADVMDGDVDAVEAALDRARLGICAELVGVMTYLFDQTLGYIRQRHQFKAAIGSFQAIQHRMADLYASLEQSRSQLYRATLTDERQRRTVIAAAKAYISVAAVHLAEECLQFHGGMGISEELDIGTALKRALLLASLFGDADYETRRYNAAA